MMRGFTTQGLLPNRRWVVWLAICLALFAALAPTVSLGLHAANQRDVADLHAVCTSAHHDATPHLASVDVVWFQGTSKVSDDSTNPVPSASAGHCPLCLLCIDRWAAPPCCVVALAIYTTRHTAPAAVSPPFVKGFPGFIPPVRGPPART
jgi:hypothetical protein